MFWFFFLFIIAIGSLSRSLTGRLHILYIPKVAIIITIVKMRFIAISPSGLSRPALFSTSGHAFWM